MSSASGSGDRPGRSLLSDAVGLDEAQRAEQLAFFELGPEDAAALVTLRPLAERAADEVVEQFYAHLQRFPELETLLRAVPGRIERLKDVQRDYFLSLTDGRLDADYFESRLRVGDAHQGAGLRPMWYLGAFSRLLRLALRTLLRDVEDPHTVPALEALTKLVFLDASLAMHTYIYGGFVRREIAAEREEAARVAEEALRARAETERLKDDLTSMVVHDLKNPVNGILMMVQLALRKGGELPEPHRGYMQQVERTCREMMRLIQNLLEIGKIEEGKMPIHREAVALAELVGEVVREYAPVAEQSNRVLVVRVGADLPPVTADRALLKRVLVNLVANALRHSGSPEVRIAAQATPQSSEVVLNIVDQGRGIPLEQQARIFEKFTTVRRSPTADPGVADTGLGLPFCKLALERMGGRIAVHSAPGRETTFAATLPVWRG
ncbi:MAG: protoglobin domain-containing protein [Candidatus Binatia bacterium]